MKTIRRVIQIMAIGMACVYCFGCSSTKLRNSAKVESTTIEKNAESLHTMNQHSYDRVIRVGDSTAATYRVIIFPKDSFQFSMNEGFIGKATKVELFGQTMRHKQIYDSTIIDSKIDYQESLQLEREKKEQQISVSKAVTRKKIPGLWMVLVGIGVVVGVGWYLRRKLNKNG